MDGGRLPLLQIEKDDLAGVRDERGNVGIRLETGSLPIETFIAITPNKTFKMLTADSGRIMKALDIINFYSSKNYKATSKKAITISDFFVWSSY